jgi:hypothetical protein
MLDISNLTEFFEEHRKNYVDQLKQLNVLNKEGKIEQKQKDVLACFASFVFQKEDLSSIQ